MDVQFHDLLNQWGDDDPMLVSLIQDEVMLSKEEINFRNRFELMFKTDNYKYLTCPNEYDSTCWQKIIYYGDESLLTQWKRHQ